MKVFKDNNIGQKKFNNGLLLLISSEEKKIRIVVWYGLEWVYPDLLASQVIENDIRPLVDRGDVVWAIRVFYQRSMQIIGWEIPYSKPSSSRSGTVADYVPLILGFLLWVLLKSSLSGILKDKKYKKKIVSFWLISLVIAIFIVFVVYFWALLFLFLAWFVWWIIGLFPWLRWWGWMSFWWGSFSSFDWWWFDGGGWDSGGGWAGD